MPLFTVLEKGQDKPRLFEAKSREKALEATIAGRFSVDLVSKPADVAKLMGTGVAMEDAAAVIAAADKPADPPAQGAAGTAGADAAK